jgi:hypothetical protein
MKNRPKEIRRLLKLVALTAAKELYPGPKYKVSLEGNTVYIERQFKDGMECILILDISVC